MSANLTKPSPGDGAQHTPLPWMQDALHPATILGNGQRGHQSFEITADAYFVRNWPEDSKALREANARLIVQAVNERAELLDIMKRIVFAADAKLLSEKHRVIDDARAALAKSKGAK